MCAALGVVLLHTLGWTVCVRQMELITRKKSVLIWCTSQSVIRCGAVRASGSDDDTLSCILQHMLPIYAMIFWNCVTVTVWRHCVCMCVMTALHVCVCVCVCVWQNICFRLMKSLNFYTVRVWVWMTVMSCCLCECIHNSSSLRRRIGVYFILFVCLGFVRLG